jgi:hypothetical protein
VPALDGAAADGCRMARPCPASSSVVAMWSRPSAKARGTVTHRRSSWLYGRPAPGLVSGSRGPYCRLVWSYDQRVHSCIDPELSRYWGWRLRWCVPRPLPCQHRTGPEPVGTTRAAWASAPRSTASSPLNSARSSPSSCRSSKAFRASTMSASRRRRRAGRSRRLAERASSSRRVRRLDSPDQVRRSRRPLRRLRPSSYPPAVDSAIDVRCRPSPAAPGKALARSVNPRGGPGAPFDDAETDAHAGPPERDGIPKDRADRAMTRCLGPGLRTRSLSDLY